MEKKGKLDVLLETMVLHPRRGFALSGGLAIAAALLWFVFPFSLGAPTLYIALYLAITATACFFGWSLTHLSRALRARRTSSRPISSDFGQAA